MSKQLERFRSGEKFDNYDWSNHSPNQFRLPGELVKSKGQFLISECLRDGLHGTGVYPTSSEMIEYIRALNKLGIDQTTVGMFPGTSNNIDATIKELIAHMQIEFPNITPIVLSITTKDSLDWTGELVKLNPRLKAIVFRGTAASRMFVQDWTEEEILSDMCYFISETVKQGVQVIGATEHTTQTEPGFLKEIIEAQVNSGASEFCIADTIGVADEAAAYNIVEFTKNVLKNMGRDGILVHWHGHRDMGNDLGNAKAAILAGADRIHAVAWGIGERAGNAALETILLNFDHILKKECLPTPWKIKELWNVLLAYCKLIDLPIPSHGVLSKNAFKTQLGLHTDAMLKAWNLSALALTLGEEEVASRLDIFANTIYCAINPKDVGREHEIEVGPSSGRSTVKLLAKYLGLEEPEEEKILRILEKAKSTRNVLTRKEIFGDQSDYD